MTAPALPTVALRRVWARALAWAVRPDNATTDFAVIGAFNAGVGAVLAVAPALAHSPSLVVLMATLPRAVWSVWFTATAAVIFTSLRTRNRGIRGRLRHYSWLSAGTLLVMWLTGILFSTASVTSVLLIATLLAWYTLTAARLELPRFLRDR